jgi:hypothetical protein
MFVSLRNIENVISDLVMILDAYEKRLAHPNSCGRRQFSFFLKTSHCPNVFQDLIQHLSIASRLGSYSLLNLFNLFQFLIPPRPLPFKCVSDYGRIQ